MPLNSLGKMSGVGVYSVGGSSCVFIDTANELLSKNGQC